MKLTDKLINLVRQNEEDFEIIQHLENELKKIFILGFGVDDSKTVVKGWHMHADEPALQNKELFEVMNEVFKEDGSFETECAYCENEVDFLLVEHPYETTHCCGVKCNYWIDFGLNNEIIPYCEVYEDYVENNAERIYQETIKEKAKNRVLGKSDLDVFKAICLQLFKEHHIEFSVYPWNESGCTSWLYTDILEGIYDSSSDGYYGNYDRNKSFRIDTDQLLYENKACFFANKWEHKVTLLKAFNGKIYLNVTNLDPMFLLKDFDQDSSCYIKMDWTERTRNIPKKKLLYSMPYNLIYVYFFVRKMSFTLFSRPKQLLREKYYDFEYKLKQILRIKDDPPF